MERTGGRLGDSMVEEGVEGEIGNDVSLPFPELNRPNHWLAHFTSPENRYFSVA